MRGVKIYRRLCDSWTTTGVVEEILLLDTEGWEFGQATKNLFKQCMETAKCENIQLKVLQHRLVLGCVLNAEDRSHMSDPKFLSLVKDVCKHAKREAGGAKPVLLPIISK